jgi:plastocyanin
MRGLLSLLVLGAGLVLAAPAVAADRPVAFADFSYSPADTTIKANDTATFSGDFVRHPLIWGNNAFSDTRSGPSRTFTFSQPGNYTYLCEAHGATRNMVGVVRVVANQHPATVSFAVSPSPRAGQPVTFTYTGSPDPDGTLTAWKWDLDGDGSFETATPTGAATTTYATARTVTVRMIAVDDSGEDSAVAQQVVAIAAGSGPGGPGTGASGSEDTIAPRATLIKLSGLKLSFRASEKASATATLRARGKTIAKGSAKAKSGAISIRLKLTSAGRSVLRRGHRLKATLALTLRDSAGNRRSVKKTLTVRRP